MTDRLTNVTNDDTTSYTITLELNAGDAKETDSGTKETVSSVSVIENKRN